MNLPKRFLALLLALPLFALAAQAQLPALTDSADGQTLASDTASADDEAEFADSSAEPAMPASVRHAQRSFIIDGNAAPADIARFLGLPLWAERATGLLGRYVFPGYLVQGWPSLDPLFSTERNSAGDWVRLCLLLLAGAAALCLLFQEKRRLPAQPGDEMAAFRRREFLSSLHVALWVLAGGLFFAVWPAVACSAAIAICAAWRHAGKKA